MARKITNRLISLPQDVSIDRVVEHPHSLEIFISCPDSVSVRSAAPATASSRTPNAPSPSSTSPSPAKALSSRSMYRGSAGSSPLPHFSPPASDSPAPAPYATAPSTTGSPNSRSSLSSAPSSSVSRSLSHAPSVSTSSKALPAPTILIHTVGMSTVTTPTFPTAISAASSMSSRRSPWTSCSPTSWTIPLRNAGASVSSAVTCTVASSPSPDAASRMLRSVLTCSMSSCF